MATENTTTPADTSEVESSGLSEGEAAQELLKRWGAAEGGDKDEPTGGDEESDDEPVDEEPSEEEGTTSETADDSDDATPEDGDIEIDVNGEKFKLPKNLAEQAKRIEAKAKEVEAGAQRKFQEAADLRKAVEVRADQVEQLRELGGHLSDLIADYKMVTRRMAQFEKINLAQLEQDDPAALARVTAEYTQLQAAQKRIEQTYAHGVREYEGRRNGAEADRLRKLDEFASKTIKDWSTSKGTALRDYAMKKGMSLDQLRTTLSPEFLQILDDAEYGARVRNAKPMRKAEPQKTLKPGGAAGTKTPAVAKAETAMRRLHQTGSVQDAAMALLHRSGASSGRRK